MAATTTTTIPVNIQGYYDRNLLMRATPALLYSKLGQIRPIPKNEGDRITFRRYGALAVASALTEGTTPSGKQLSVTDIYASMGQYGDFVTLTDRLLDTGLDPVLVEAGEILGEQAGLTIDSIHRDVLAAGTTVRYANAVASRAAVATAVAADDLNSAIRTLEGNNAKKIRTMNLPGTKIETVPLRAGFIGITHTDCRQDYEALTGFIPVERYPTQKDVMEEEIGTYRGVRLLATTNAKVWTASGVAVGATGLISSDDTNIDVYSTLVFAKDAYGIIPLQRKNIENIIKKAKNSGTDDPLNQRNTSGWKAYTVCKILNNDFMVRIEHGCSEL